MKKIRINELARELEVKPGVILDMLPDLGVQEKKTHSSSIDEDVALELRQRLVAEGRFARRRNVLTGTFMTERSRLIGNLNLLPGQRHKISPQRGRK